LANPVGGTESEVERVRELVRLEVDAQLRCPAEGKETVTHEALSRLDPHLKRALESLETIIRAREFTEEELAGRGGLCCCWTLPSSPATCESLVALDRSGAPE
jgi:hypothetical protein